MIHPTLVLVLNSFESNEGLAPGVQTTFEWVFSDPPKFDGCQAKVFEYDIQ